MKKEIAKIEKKNKKLDIMGAGPSPLRMLARYLYNKDLTKTKKNQINRLIMKVDDFDNMNRDAKASYRMKVRTTLEEVMQNLKDNKKKIVKSQRVDKSYPDLKKKKKLSVDKSGNFKFASGGKITKKKKK